MKKTDKFKRIFLILGAVLFCFGITANTCLAQDDQSKGVTSDDYKKPGVTSDDYIKTRPKTKNANGGTRVLPKPKYKIVSLPKSPKQPKPKGNGGRRPPKRNGNSVNVPNSGAVDTEPGIVGLTFWRRRESKGENENKGLGEREEKVSQVISEGTWERLESNTLLEPGANLRLSIESLSRKGYLYIIDREEFSDGTFGEPMLIFPTSKTPSNFVSPGKLIFIPPNSSFIVETWGKGKKLTADHLTIIVSPKMLIDVSQLDSPQTKLSLDQVKLWENQWGADTTILEQIDSKGKLMAKVEEEASKGLGEKSLTQEDPSPQTVYKTSIKRNAPILIKVPLKYKGN
jgi:hypothetical protein